MRIFFLFVSLLVWGLEGQYTQIENQIFFQSNSWDYISSTVTQGSTEGFYTFNEIQTLLLGYKEYFPEVVQELRIIGNTIDGLPIYAICLSKVGDRILESANSTNSTLNSSTTADISAEISQSTNFSSNYTPQRQSLTSLTNDKPNILLTSGIRGSDYISVSMALYLIKYFLFGYIHNDDEVNYILESRFLWIIPILNTDTYLYIGEKYVKTLSLVDIQKNRRLTDCDDPVEIGVYLASNYDFNYNVNNWDDQFTGQCNKYYKGTSAFSEPETQAHKSFLKSQNFKFAINFMSSRNCIFVPYNSFGMNSTLKYEENEKVYNRLQSFSESSYLPKNAYFGTLYDFSRQTISGELSDYLYHTLGIVNFNAELGSSDLQSGEKFPNLNTAQVIMKNYMNFTKFSILKAGEYFLVNIDSQQIRNCDSSTQNLVKCSNIRAYFLRINVSNQGLSDSPNSRILEFNMGKYIKLQKAYYQSQIQNADILNQLSSLSPAEMTYQGVNQNNESFYNLYIPSMPAGSSKIYVLMGNLSNYQEAYQTKIFITDKGAPSSPMFLKSSISIEYIQSNYPRNEEGGELSSDLNDIERKPSVILIIVYASAVFCLLFFYNVLTTFKKM